MSFTSTFRRYGLDDPQPASVANHRAANDRRTPGTLFRDFIPSSINSHWSSASTCKGWRLLHHSKRAVHHTRVAHTSEDALKKHAKSERSSTSATYVQHTFLDHAPRSFRRVNTTDSPFEYSVDLEEFFSSPKILSFLANEFFVRLFIVMSFATVFVHFSMDRGVFRFSNIDVRKASLPLLLKRTGQSDASNPCSW